MSEKSFESILAEAGVYSTGLELKILDHYEYLRSKLHKPFTKLLAENKQLQAELDKLKSRRLSNSCLPCAALGGDCCGMLYWEDDGRILCNECGQEYEIALKGEPK